MGKGAVQRYLTVRNTLCGIAAIGMFLLIALAADLWSDAWRQQREAKRILALSVIEDALMESALAWSVERAIAHTSLNRKAAIASAESNALATGRGRGD